MTILHHHWMAVDVRQHFNSAADLHHPWGADENGVEGLIKPLDVEIGFKGVVLAAKGISFHHDVKTAEQGLIRADHFFGKKDHSGTSPPRGHAGFDSLDQRVDETEAGSQFADRGRFPTRDDQRFHQVELDRGANEDRLRPDRFEGDSVLAEVALKS